ncbi:hypothetical protein FJZ31_28315 [Candidatus Poribacteria bacterium]|nr:hypothetical protein [Candidatus Poribacteria bacterium]
MAKWQDGKMVRNWDFGFRNGGLVCFNSAFRLPRPLASLPFSPLASLPFPLTMLVLFTKVKKV